MNLVSGTMFSYYFICKRKMWLHFNQISLESNHENVKLGKVLDQNSYKREIKNIRINNEINIDYFAKEKTVHEIKKSNRMEESHLWQVKYYIYYLNKLGLENIKGVIDYPLLRKKRNVELLKEDTLRINSILKSIELINQNNIPNIPRKVNFCKKCAFYEFCYI